MSGEGTSTAARIEGSAGRRGTSAARKSRPWWGGLLLRLHFYAGVLVGPFILVSALSGALYALAPTIERVVYQHELRAADPIAGEALTLSEQIRLAQAYVGGDPTPIAVRPAPEPGATTRVMFEDPALGPSESRGVFVDPGSGEIRGDLAVYGTSGALPLRTWLSTMHRNLHLGETGRLYSELAASWLGPIALAGLALWVVRRRRSRSTRDFVFPSRSHRGYRRFFSWHASLGVWVVLGAVFLSATGVTWSQYAGANIGSLRATLDWGTPAVVTTLDSTTPAGTEHDGAHDGHGGAHDGHGGIGDDAAASTANPATFDAVLAIARRTTVTAAPVEVLPPAAPGSAWVVREIKGSFPTGANAVAIDGTRLEVVDSVDFDDFPLAAKLTRWGIDLHSGFLFGLANQIALFLLALGIAAMVVLGYVLWWTRRPTRPPRRLVGTPPARGSLRGAPWWGITVVLVTAVAVGFWLPLVGWTLAAFVVFDTILGTVQARRSRAG